MLSTSLELDNNTINSTALPVFADLRQTWNEYRLGADMEFAGFRFTVLHRWDYFKQDTPYSAYGIATSASLGVPNDLTTLQTFTKAQPVHGSESGLAGEPGGNPQVVGGERAHQLHRRPQQLRHERICKRPGPFRRCGQPADFGARQRGPADVDRRSEFQPVSREKADDRQQHQRGQSADQRGFQLHGTRHRHQFGGDGEFPLPGNPHGDEHDGRQLSGEELVRDLRHVRVYGPDGDDDRRLLAAGLRQFVVECYVREFESPADGHARHPGAAVETVDGQRGGRALVAPTIP